MKTLSKPGFANSRCSLMTAYAGISANPFSRTMTNHASKQRGVVLFLTLLALLAMSLAAVALIRSVDTSTLIAGNLAFKQAATSGGDSGIEDAIIWIRARDAANGNKNVFIDPSHTLNQSAPGLGYFSYVDGRSLTDPYAAAGHFNWTSEASAMTAPDSARNTRRYIIQRMCKLVDREITYIGAAGTNECLFGGVPETPKNDTGIQKTSDRCPPENAGCPHYLGQVTQFRITVQITSPKGFISYVQAFAY